MNSLDLKQELHNYINKGDDKFVKMFYEMAKAYLDQTSKDKMIEESEDDILKGNLYSQNQVQETIESWKKQ